MTKNTLSASIFAVLLLTAAAVCADGKTWPPRCAGYRKASKSCLLYVNGNVTEIPEQCCPTLSKYLAPAKDDSTKKKAACYCISNFVNGRKYHKGRAKDVLKECDFPIPPSFFDCRT
ncbi:hypothetical protein LINPERPRIM_LOCUS34584 [Linum perenne]